MRLLASHLVPGLLLVSGACTPSWTAGPVANAPTPVSRPVSPSSYRVIETATGRTISLPEMLDRAARSDVVFFGEMHDDPETHFLEFAVLEGLGLRHRNVVLSLEMFERDVQGELDQYLAGTTDEKQFLANSRPWPRYATDYRPMVMLARARGWPVVASNIPRPMASAIARASWRALDTLPTTQRAFAAATMNCPTDDEYFRRFAATMSGHSAGGGPATAADASAAAAMTQRYYEAQCAKDETMAESIARVLPASGRPQTIVLHVDGAFHSDFGLGTVSRVLRRAPAIRHTIITAVPVDDPATAQLGEHARKANYVVFTRRPK